MIGEFYLNACRKKKIIPICFYADFILFLPDIIKRL